MPAPRSFLLGVVAVLVALGAWHAARPAVADPDAAEATVQSAISEVLADPELPAAFWGIYVQDVATGRVVYRLNADKNFVPASNLKLFTTALALDVLGPAHRYATRVYFRGETSTGGVMTGDLVLRGAGDPTFGSRHAEGDPLTTWAEALAANGVRRLRGRLVGDDDVFDDAPYAEGWDVAHVATESYAPAVGGLSYADNLARVEIAGSGNGAATVRVRPEGYVRLENRVGVQRRGGYSPFRVNRVIGTNRVELRGRVSSGYRGTVSIPIEDPTAFTLHAFAAALRRAGIAVEADLVDVDDLEETPDYEALGDPLLVHLSPPLSQIVARINQRSDNFYAEQVLRTVGGGSAGGGARAVLAFLERSGIPTDGLSIEDGSGLSRKDLVTPEAMARVLTAMATHEAGRVYEASLAEGGSARGTLRYRLAGVPVRGKTGSLDYVRSLSGYVDAPGGRTLAFALLANNYTTRPGRIAEAQDRIVRSLAAGGRVEPAEAVEE